jgi:hypothetical protein
LVWISSKENRDVSVEKQKIANMIKGDANIFRKKWAKIFVHEKDHLVVLAAVWFVYCILAGWRR